MPMIYRSIENFVCNTPRCTMLCQAAIHIVNSNNNDLQVCQPDAGCALS